MGFWWGNLKERDHLENKGTDGHTILKLSLRNIMEWHELNLTENGGFM